MAGAADTATPWRPLKALLGGGFEVPEQFEISDLTLDSRSVRPGAAFLACRGRTRHGLEFAQRAVAAGARAVLWEPAPGVSAPDSRRRCWWSRCRSCRRRPATSPIDSSARPRRA